MSLLRTVPRTVWLLGLAHAVTDFSPGALYVALPFLKAKFGLSYVEVSAIVLMQNVASSLSQPFFGYMSDKKPRAWLMPLGCALTGVGMLASLLVPAYSLVLLCTALSGLGNAAFHPEAAKTVHRVAGPAKGQAISIFSVGGYGGLALGSLFLGTLLLDGQSLTLLWYTVPSLFAAALLLALLRPLPAAVGAPAGSSLAALRSCLSWPLFALLGTILMRATLSSGLSTFAPLFFIAYLGGQDSAVRSLLTVYLAAGAAGTLLGGMLSDRYGSRRVMLYTMWPVALTVYAFVHSSGASASLWLAVASILLSATATSSLVLTQRLMPKHIGMASGLTLGFSVGLGTLGVLALGRIADMAGLPWVFYILLALPFLGFVMTWFVEEPANA